MQFLFAVWALMSLLPTASFGQIKLDSEEELSRIAFGSCANQNKPCPIWNSIADYQPDLLLMLGDNIYADLVDGRLKPSTPERIQASYQQLASVEGYAAIRKSIPILATWDDHDYGNNDAGREWEHKRKAAELFHDFFGVPEDSPLRKREGIYQSKVIGPVGRRVQILLLDTRFFRSELKTAAEPLPGFRARPYIAIDGDEAELLGETQWKWLEEQLLQPAELRILCSSIQVLSNDHPFEKWGNFPREQQRLFDLIRKCEASGVVIISGDRHLGEISLDPVSVGYPLHDVTASGLNQASTGWRTTEPNQLRLAALQYGNHFGSIEIDWQPEDPIVHLQLRHEDGQLAVQTRVPLSKLQALPTPLPLPDGVVNAATALQRVTGESVQVQFVVRGGRMFGQRDRLLLNSEQDHRKSSNFTIVVNQPALTAIWEEADLSTFLGRTIRVSGKLSEYRGAKQVVVDTPEQLTIVEKN